jgi:ribosomal protein L24
MAKPKGANIPKRLWLGDIVKVVLGRYEGSVGKVIEREGNNRQVLVYRVRVEFTERNEHMVKDQKRTIWMSARQVEIVKHSRKKLDWDRRCEEKARGSACSDDQ